MQTVEGICRKYRGHEKLRRLEWLANAMPSAAAAASAAAVAAARAETTDTATYRRLAGASADASWVEETERGAALKQSHLDKELALLSNSNMRDSIRRTFIDLAAFLVERGDFSGAIRAWGRACEYCSSSKQLAEAHLSLAELHAQTGALAAVAFHAGRLDANADAAQPAVAARLKTCLGLASFLKGDMAAAAAHFLAVPVPPPPAPSAQLAPLSPLLHPEEISLYASLAAVASCSREGLRALFLQGGSPMPGPAKQHLEQAPPALRTLVDDLVACRYSSALRGLAALAPALASDPFAAPQAATLSGLVRRLCAVQYLQPYCSVDLAAMAPVFGLTVAELERDVIIPLITAGEVPFRLDALQHRLDALVAEPRVVAFDRVARLAREFEVDARAALLRLSMERQGVLVKHASGAAAGGGAAGASAGDDGGQTAGEHGPVSDDVDLLLSL